MTSAPGLTTMPPTVTGTLMGIEPDLRFRHRNQPGSPAIVTRQFMRLEMHCTGTGTEASAARDFAQARFGNSATLKERLKGEVERKGDGAQVHD